MMKKEKKNALCRVKKLIIFTGLFKDYGFERFFRFFFKYDIVRTEQPWQSKRNDSYNRK